MANANQMEELRAIEMREKWQAIATERGDREQEGDAYDFLGNEHASLGENSLAIEKSEKSLEVSWELEDRDGEGGGRTGAGLRNAHEAVGPYRRAIEMHQKCMSTAMEAGDLKRVGGGVWGPGYCL